LATNQGTCEAEISSLFKDAIFNLEKIDIQAKNEKKQIIIHLAKDLEGTVPTDGNPSG
jgi:hypothetical protein